MKNALQLLDQKLVSVAAPPLKLLMGGGGAMILAHGFPLATSDIDAVPMKSSITLDQLDRWVKEIAGEASLPPDWLNPYFSTFSHTLPADYGSRLIEVFSGKLLQVEALGKDEMLIMKCFAHRRKDVGHARALVRGGANLKRVESRIEELSAKGIPGADAALEFLDEILELEGTPKE